MVSICPSQYATSADSFSETHRKTARSSFAARWPAMIRGEGRTATTAVFAAFIWFPCVILTLTRTSWRALPRGLTHTVIGRPVVAGNRFAISKRSCASVSGGKAATSQIQHQELAAGARAADQHVGLARLLAEDRVAVVGFALQIARHAGGAVTELARGAGLDAVATQDGDDRLARRHLE